MKLNHPGGGQGTSYHWGPFFPDNIKLWLKFETEMNLDVKVKQNVVKWQNIMSSSLCMDLPDLISDEKIYRRQGSFALWKCDQVIFGCPRKFWIITCSSTVVNSCSFPPFSIRPIKVSDCSACWKSFHRGQGALNLTSPFISDLGIFQSAFELLCYLVLFYNWTKIELDFA